MLKPIPVKRNYGLYMRMTANKGLGVFCETPTRPGEVLETTPCILFPSSEAKDIDKTSLYNYYFSGSFLNEEEARKLNILDKDKAGVIACGVMGFCNHSSQPNGEIIKYVRDERIFFELQALKAIQAHEEITISYGEVWFNELD